MSVLEGCSFMKLSIKSISVPYFFLCVKYTHIWLFCILLIVHNCNQFYFFFLLCAIKMTISSFFVLWKKIMFAKINHVWYREDVYSLLFNNQKLKDKLALVKLPTTFRNTCVCMCFPFSSKFRLLTIYRISSGILVVKYNVDASNVRLKFTILTANTFS